MHLHRINSLRLGAGDLKYGLRRYRVDSWAQSPSCLYQELVCIGVEFAGGSVQRFYYQKDPEYARAGRPAYGVGCTTFALPAFRHSETAASSSSLGSMRITTTVLPT